MRVFLLLVLSAGCILAKKETCEIVTQEDCENLTSEYEKYRACMEHRSKRSVGCYKTEEDECDNCECESCSYSSCENCGSSCCSQCCQKSACSSYSCCHQTCRAECRSNTCRTSCKKKCQERLTAVNGTATVSTSNTQTNHNITTIIHLNNVINNTNLINLPINVNNTILNNITNEGRYGGGGTTNDNCCLTIGPRQCVPQKEVPYTRCFHVRRKACGSVCSAPVVHYQKHEICDNDVNVQQPCRQQIVYVPQPQPRCAYQPNWPYVTCGNRESYTCDGCYSHYVKREDVSRCSSFCYDDGYGVGPYYRQGPFYRPGLAHAPSCYQTGLCDNFENSGYEGSSGYGFPYSYPPQSYPYIIEDCENCTFPFSWDGPGGPVLNEIFPGTDVQWNNLSDKIMNIDTKIYPARSERYAEIKIDPTNKVKGVKETEKTSTTAKV